MWSWKTFPGDLEYAEFTLNPDVGELEFTVASDGRYDETLGVPGRPGPEDYIEEGPVKGE